MPGKARDDATAEKARPAENRYQRHFDAYHNPRWLSSSTEISTITRSNGTLGRGGNCGAEQVTSDGQTPAVSVNVETEPRYVVILPANGPVR